MSSALLSDEHRCSSVACIDRQGKAACAISHSPESVLKPRFSPVVAVAAGAKRARRGGDEQAGTFKGLDFPGEVG